MIDGRGIIAEHEVEALVNALQDGTGRQVSEAEAQEFVAWAGKVRIDVVILDEVLAGRLSASRQPDGQFSFSAGPPREV